VSMFCEEVLGYLMFECRGAQYADRGPRASGRSKEKVTRTSPPNSQNQLFPEAKGSKKQTSPKRCRQRIGGQAGECHRMVTSLQVWSNEIHRGATGQTLENQMKFEYFEFF